MNQGAARRAIIVALVSGAASTGLTGRQNPPALPQEPPLVFRSAATLVPIGLRLWTIDRPDSRDAP
jgi:hypothetical protein